MRYGARGFGQLSLALGRRLVGLLPGLLLGLSFVLPVGAQTKSADNAPPVVLVQPAELRPLAPQSEYIGRVAVFDKVELRARVKGTLGKREFTDGSKVTEGQLLFTIEPAPYRIAVDPKRALRDGARAALINAADAVHGETETAQDLRFLLGAGSPVGGARPKSVVALPDGRLAIAKFPKPDDIRAVFALPAFIHNT